ncbi:Slam-dependent surface lipoprotein [Neisseria zalophi]|uniref:Hemoglobin-haptoglobin-utilization protein n=1 Tax=Neisseria zalophi TaxID=640030 RepID=A0A5J6PZ09_9NEIS|nr:Slam-dependent surface lipoprotein [Neisseria zalophi]QEY26087.1 hypothetical protein D0T92_05765 [Neisseria zalophi]
MTNISFKPLYPALALPFLLAACAGGGKVEPPKVLAERPVLESLDITAKNVKKHDDNKSFVSVTNNGGAVEKYAVTTQEKSSWSDAVYDVTNNVYVYKTPDGKYYQFNNFNTPMVPDYATPDKSMRTIHEMQSTRDGGKFFACCTAASNQTPGIDFKEDLYFGAWISPTGESHLFAGGKVADPAYMQGGSAAEIGGLKGKATYHVWGIRTKGDQVVSSTYSPTDVSKITVNFNTGKLGGEILGNKNFGDSVVMQDVNVQGNRFSGTARSGNATGAVDGAFYGAHSVSYWTGKIDEYAGRSIGGIVKFDGNKDLDTAFGGRRRAIDANYQGTDLKPLDN